MKRGKSIKVISVLFCIIIFLIFGYSLGNPKLTSSDSTDNNLGNQSEVSTEKKLQSDQTGSAGNAESAFDISSLKLSNSSFGLIDDLLKKQKKVIQISWSSDRYYVAFSVGNMGWDDKMYLWEIGESQPVEIRDMKDRICGFSWSPNNNYVLADSGSSVQRIGYIVDAQTKKETDEISYVGNAFWSPDSKWLAVGEISDIQPSIATELTGTVDMYIYNADTKEKKIIAQGTADYYFDPKEWNSNDVLTYVKTDFKDPDKQEVITYGNAKVDEITYVNEKYSFSLVFPAYWQGQYTVEDVRGVGIRIHHKPTWLKNEGGTLFQITVFDKSIDGWKDQYEGSDAAVGLKKIYEDNKVVVGFSTPTDVQYITDDKILYRGYMKMENDVTKIAETFKKID